MRPCALDESSLNSGRVNIRIALTTGVPIEPSRNIWYDLRGLVRGGSGRLGGRKGEKYLFGLVGLGMLA